MPCVPERSDTADPLVIRSPFGKVNIICGSEQVRSAVMESGLSVPESVRLHWALTPTTRADGGVNSASRGWASVMNFGKIAASGEVGT